MREGEGVGTDHRAVGGTVVVEEWWGRELRAEKDATPSHGCGAGRHGRLPGGGGAESQGGTGGGQAGHWERAFL